MSTLAKMMELLEKTYPEAKEIVLTPKLRELLVPGSKAEKISIDELKQVMNQKEALKKALQKEYGKTTTDFPKEQGLGKVDVRVPELVSSKKQVDDIVRQQQNIKQPKLQNEADDILEQTQKGAGEVDFTPEWKKKLMGVGVVGGAAPKVNLNPLEMLSTGYNKYADVRDKAHEKLAEQLDLSGQDKSNIQQVLGVAADPVNLVGGAPGVGLGGMQVLLDHMRETKKPEDDFKKTKGLFTNGKD